MSKIRTPAMEKLDKKVKKNAKVTSNHPREGKQLNVFARIKPLWQE